MSNEDYIESKVFELFNSDYFLQDGSFAEMVKSDEIKKATNELLFELVKQNVNSRRGSIKSQVEKVVDLIIIEAYALAEKLA
jgi:hypothetical protein